MLCMAMVVFTRCNWKKEFLPEITSIESMQSQLDSVLLHSDHKMPDNLAIIHAAIINDIGFIQDHFAAEMNKSMAEKISNYRNIPSVLPNPEDQWLNVLAACSVSKSQLSQLKQVITSEANTDSLGNTIDATYLAEAIKAEKASAQQSLALYQEYKRLYALSLEQYSKEHNSVKHWIDSLQLQMTP